MQYNDHKCLCLTFGVKCHKLLCPTLGVECLKLLVSTSPQTGRTVCCGEWILPLIMTVNICTSCTANQHQRLTDDGAEGDVCGLQRRCAELNVYLR